MKNLQLAIGLIAFFFFQFGYGQETKTVNLKKVYTTKSIEGLKAPVIDGAIDDDIWNNVEWGVDFIENEPDENTAPTYQTQFKIVYDAKYLYVAIRSFDPEPDKIEKRLSRRDGFQGDRVNLVIDSYHDLRTAFIFTVTAAGVKGDEISTNNGDNIDDSWNPVWFTKVRMIDAGWEAEMKIPFSQLRFGNAKEQVWGLNIVRNLFRKNERSLWNRVPADASGFISESGELHGLKNLKPQKQLEIQPFTVVQYDTYPKEDGNPFKDGSDFKLNGGIDAKIGITNDLTLDLTINPDFGQVEADPGNFALDGFQIFLEEKRPFFVENKNIFDYRFANSQDNLFYSRRIGRGPHGRANLAAGEYADTPINTTILGAAKFSGKTKSGWSIGLLESVTANEYAIVKGNGESRKELVEPLTNYLVVRAQKDFNNRNSYIGGIFTATNRSFDDEFPYLHKAAYTGGLDFRHSWKNRNYFVSGNVVVSTVTGSKEAIEQTQRSITHLFQRVDASHVSVDPTRTSLSGSGGRISAGKSGGGNWRYGGNLTWKSPELELNDIGFLRQADEISQDVFVRYQFLKPTKLFSGAGIKLEQSATYDFEGNYNRFKLEAGMFVNWKNNWWTDFGMGHKPRIFINTFLRGGPRWRFSEENFMFLFFGSDQSKKFNFTLGHVNTAAKERNFSFKRYVIRFGYQPTDALNFSLETSFNENPNRTQYVTERTFGSNSRYILGEIDQRTWSTSLRVNYSLNPNLSMQFYGSPFITRGRYSNFNYVNNPTAKNLNDRVTWYDSDQITEENGMFLVDENKDATTDYSFGKPDFAFVQFRSNLVIRWEYIPGSELFLVWSRGISGFGDPEASLGRSIQNQIFDKTPNDTFLIKLTYRFVK
ncbi:MAG: carbohydrate binding family 9 domain-containing protein [Flavobacteriaceae bacterium]|nr:carbohydrate binding family 9 domain-containing protein [Flavobacteriaceae bacterium]